MDNISIYLGKHGESSIIRNNSFRFKRAYYGDNTFCFIIPANLLLDYKKEIEVEFSYYNVVHAVQKQLTLNLNIEVIDRESCQVSYFSKCDIPWILRPILSKDIVPSNTYIEKMVTKYRNPIFIGDIESDIREYLLKTLKSLDRIPITMEILPDQIHLLVDCKPPLRLSDARKILKGSTAR